MKFLSNPFVRPAALIVLLLAAGTAQAHTGHDTSGVSEGLAHPMGFDHLLAMVAVGIWTVSSLPVHKAWWGPATFLLVLTVSATLGSLGFSLPLLEQMISLSVVLLGAMLVLSRVKLPTVLGLGLVALVASLHGLAHGTEAPAASFAGYAAGFLTTTAALHFGGVTAGLAVRRYLAQKSNWVMATLGAGFGGSGLYLFSQL